MSALEKAENYSLKAKDAAEAAANDIKMAEDKITSVRLLSYISNSVCVVLFFKKNCLLIKSGFSVKSLYRRGEID